MLQLTRIFISLLIIVVCLEPVKASPQSPDFLIIGKDTFLIYFLPLHHLDERTQKLFFENLQSDSASFGFTFNLWRGYRAYWELSNDSLFLIDLKGYKQSDEILQKTFPDHYHNKKVFAYWFSSYLAIGKDKMLKWDGIFSRTYFKEDVFEFNNGILTERKTVNNYEPVKNGISRLDENRKIISHIFFKRIKGLNWKKLSDCCDCDDKYLITVDESGKVSDIELAPYTSNPDTAQMEIESHKLCIQKFKTRLKDLQFDIVRWNGKPYKEKYYLELFYTVEGKLENWTR